MEYNIFGDIKSIYLKTKNSVKDKQMYQIFAILKWLSYDEDNLEILNKLLKYIYFVSPDTFYTMLFLSIKKKIKVPFLHKITKESKKETSELYKRIQETLQYSDREMKLYSNLFDKTILPNKDYWEKELGLT